MKRETKVGIVATGMLLGLAGAGIATALGVLALGVMVVKWAWGG